ncbi:hypothetical protein ACOI22_03585 [Glaciecola sp. 2405UD65-10]|uniref:hypothetical protein n=1 Tax=Glaciecola sp. 2405UD65-10 TaxID=3397244 RepID=UPI003B5A6262
MSNSKNNSGNGMGFLSVLTLIFITLKLTGYITWGWFWVLSPITVPLTIGVLALLFYASYKVLKG